MEEDAAGEIEARGFSCYPCPYHNHITSSFLPADRYRIQAEIGSGGMATVYLGQDLRHNREVAVKVLDPDLSQNLGAERFLR